MYHPNTSKSSSIDAKSFLTCFPVRKIQHDKKVSACEKCRPVKHWVNVKTSEKSQDKTLQLNVKMFWKQKFFDNQKKRKKKKKRKLSVLWTWPGTFVCAEIWSRRKNCFMFASRNHVHTIGIHLAPGHRFVRQVSVIFLGVSIAFFRRATRRFRPELDGGRKITVGHVGSLIKQNCPWFAPGLEHDRRGGGGDYPITTSPAMREWHD